MTRILAATVPVQSHAATVRRVAADLASRGHDVTFISGAALNLATDTPAEADIRAAGETVTSDPAYRTHTQRLQAAIGRHSPFDEIAQAVNEVSGH